MNILKCSRPGTAQKQLKPKRHDSVIALAMSYRQTIGPDDWTLPRSGGINATAHALTTQDDHRTVEPTSTSSGSLAPLSSPPLTRFLDAGMHMLPTQFHFAI